MKTFIYAATALLALASVPANAASIPDGCNPAVQNWANGSGYTCPIMGGSAVGSPAPVIVAPVIPTTDLPITKVVRCSSVDLKHDVLPAALRKESMPDAIALVETSPCAQ